MLEDGDVLRMIRRRMGLGDTLGALPPECGGTGATSASRANTRARVFCEAASKPGGWNADIADGPMTEITWGATYEQFKQAAGI